MTQINTWGLTGNAEAFRQGATAFRNGRDLAREWRDGFILATNEIVVSLKAEPSTLESSNYSHPSDITETNVPEESEILADELALISFSYPVDDDISADELDHTIYVKPIASKRRLGVESKNIISKAPRSGTSSQRRQSKK